MSGLHGGVQKKIQDALNKEIPYIHCYNHQLHLVLMHTICEDGKVQNFFDICSSLYNFTRRQTIAALYDGSKLKRLLNQRWTGHLLTTTTIMNNHEQTVELLRHWASSEQDAETSLLAAGLLAKVNTMQFVFISNLCMVCYMQWSLPITACNQNQWTCLRQAI